MAKDAADDGFFALFEGADTIDFDAIPESVTATGVGKLRDFEGDGESIGISVVAVPAAGVGIGAGIDGSTDSPVTSVSS